MISMEKLQELIQDVDVMSLLSDPISKKKTVATEKEVMASTNAEVTEGAAFAIFFSFFPLKFKSIKIASE